MKMRFALVAAFALSLLGAGQAQAASTWFVDQAYTDNSGCTAAIRHCRTIQAKVGSPLKDGAVTMATAGDTIIVAAGTYNEDVTVGKKLNLFGAGIGNTTIVGQPGGTSSAGILINSSAANGTVIDGFTVTRLVPSPVDQHWADSNLNSAGLSIINPTVTNIEVRNSEFTGNRTGIDINNTSGNRIKNNVITDNRTGMLFRNTTNNETVTQNEITNNWTFGMLFIDASSGSNSPVQSATGSIFTNNDISGNWYGQVFDRQSGGSIPTPGTTNLKNFSGNWFGSAAPVYSTANPTEPAYCVASSPPPCDAVQPLSQIPNTQGGTQAPPPPGSQPDIAGSAAPNIDFTPFLWTGTDTSPSNGFQGDFSQLGVTAEAAQTGSTGRIAEAVGLVLPTGTIHVLRGTYPTSAALINRSLTLLGPNAGTSPNDGTTPEDPGTRVNEATIEAPTTTQALKIAAPNVTIDGFRFTDPGTSGQSLTTIIGAGQNFGGAAPGVSIRNNLFDAITRTAVFFGGNTPMDGGAVEDNRVSYPTRASGCGTNAVASAACGHQLFNLWETDHLVFQRNVVVASPANGDRIRVLNVDFPDVSGAPNNLFDPDVTIADNTIRYSCVFTCFTIAGKTTNVLIEHNDVLIDTGNVLQFYGPFPDAPPKADSWTGGNVTVRYNVFTDTGNFAIVADYQLADLSGVHVYRNSLTGGGFRNSTAQPIDGTCNWWGSPWGPQPIQNANGSPFGPVSYLPWLSSSDLENDTCNGGTPRGVKQLVDHEVTDASNDHLTAKHDAKRLDDAAKKLDEALAGAWDGNSNDTLLAKRGEQVFQKEKEAVQKLVEILKDKKSTFDKTTLQRWIDALVGADRDLASTAIGQAVDAGADGHQLDDANNELGKGDAALPDHPTDAIEHYKNAWKKAQEAMKHLPPTD